MPKGILIVLSAPSGSGKTTIAKAIIQKHPEMLFSVSATTRAKRNGEVEGRDYFFLTKEEFEGRIQSHGLIEWEEIYGNFYGTLKSEARRAIDQGRTMVFDVDVKGALSIRKNFPNETVLIFISPPSLNVLQKRLEGRKTENSEMLEKRLDRVPMEMEKGKEFDYQVINDDLQKAVTDVDEIISNYRTSVKSSTTNT